MIETKRIDRLYFYTAIYLLVVLLLVGIAQEYTINELENRVEFLEFELNQFVPSVGLSDEQVGKIAKDRFYGQRNAGAWILDSSYANNRYVNLIPDCNEGWYPVWIGGDNFHNEWYKCTK